MELAPYIQRLQDDLRRTVTDDDSRAAVERIMDSLEPSLRLSAMELLAEAAAEITSRLRTTVVEVRLTGRDPEFRVQPTAPSPHAEPPPVEATDEDSESPTARITLRIPEGLKSKAEERATKAGQSVNTWIVAAIREATRDHAVNISIDLPSLPFLGDPPGTGDRRMTGWV